MPLIRVRRAAWTGVRAPVVARKRGNARGAKGCRKVEKEVSIGQNQSQCECREAKQTGDSPSSARKETLSTAKLRLLTILVLSGKRPLYLAFQRLNPIGSLGMLRQSSLR